MSQIHAQTVQHLDPRALLVDLNLRHDTRLTADFVASIREQGVLQPIVAVRTPEGAHRVRFGHRRTLAAIQAGQQTVPVVAAADEATDDTAQAERLVGQYAENEHRARLSTGERVEVMAQLAAFGVSAAQIAKRTKTKRTEVDAALAVSRSRLATAAATRYDFLDLEQAATVAEFEAEPEAVKALVAAASSGQFAHVAQRLRDERAAVQRQEATAQQLREAGARVIDRPEPSSPAARLDALVDAAGEVLTVDGHAACPGHAAFVGSAWGYVDPSTGNPVTARSQALDDDEDMASLLDDEDGEVEGAGFSPAAESRWDQYPSPVWVCTDPTANGHQPRHRAYDHGAARPGRGWPPSTPSSRKPPALSGAT